MRPDFMQRPGRGWSCHGFFFYKTWGAGPPRLRCVNLGFLFLGGGPWVFWVPLNFLGLSWVCLRVLGFSWVSAGSLLGFLEVPQVCFWFFLMGFRGFDCLINFGSSTSFVAPHSPGRFSPWTCGFGVEGLPHHQTTLLQATGLQSGGAGGWQHRKQALAYSGEITLLSMAVLGLRVWTMEQHVDSIAARIRFFVKCMTAFAVCVVCGVWCVVCGVWCVVCGVWCVVCGVWCVVCGVWCVVCGVWCVVCGVWCVVCGVWCVVCGVWCVVCGVWCVVCGVCVCV